VITGRVIGSVVATIKHPWYEGKTLLVIEKIDTNGAGRGDYLVAVDTVGAGAGEAVLVLDEGTGARQILGDPAAPVRSVVVGIIDAQQTTAS
jgi:ethanolamine utilization protein EutN